MSDNVVNRDDLGPGVEVLESLLREARADERAKHKSGIEALRTAVACIEFMPADWKSGADWAFARVLYALDIESFDVRALSVTNQPEEKDAQT